MVVVVPLHHLVYIMVLVVPLHHLVYIMVLVDPHHPVLMEVVVSSSILRHPNKVRPKKTI